MRIELPVMMLVGSYAIEPEFKSNVVRSEHQKVFGGVRFGLVVSRSTLGRGPESRLSKGNSKRGDEILIVLEAIMKT